MDSRKKQPKVQRGLGSENPHACKLATKNQSNLTNTNLIIDTLPETNSKSPWKWAGPQKEISSSNQWFSGASCQFQGGQTQTNHTFDHGQFFRLISPTATPNLPSFRNPVSETLGTLAKGTVSWLKKLCKSTVRRVLGGRKLIQSSPTSKKNESSIWFGLDSDGFGEILISAEQSWWWLEFWVGGGIPKKNIGRGDNGTTLEILSKMMQPYPSIPYQICWFVSFFCCERKSFYSHPVNGRDIYISPIYAPKFATKMTKATGPSCFCDTFLYFRYIFWMIWPSIWHKPRTWYIHDKDPLVEGIF